MTKKLTVPVLLITGYLGSGKTTLLNHILNNERGIRFAVIVNDIGEVNIDADLIQKGGIVGQQDDSLVALQNGCICCTLKMDLVKQLDDIMGMNRFDYIVIEASGICEPAPIAQTICSMRQMGPEFTSNGIPRLDCICTVVDALRLKDEFECGFSLTASTVSEEDIENLVIQQIEFCNIILLNKVSEVTQEELGRIRAIVRAIQPKAKIIDTDYCEVDIEELLNTHLFDFEKVATSAAWVQGIEGEIEEDEDEDHHHHDEESHDEHGKDVHHHHHHHHDEGEAEEYGIGTFVYYSRRPFDIHKFDRYACTEWPKNVIRSKGVCYFDSDRDMSILFEQAGKQMSMKQAGLWFATAPAEELEMMMARDPQLRRDWDPEYGDRMIKIVFIGQNLDKKAITDGLNSCLALK